MISMSQPSRWGTPSRQHRTKTFLRIDSENSICLIPRRLLTSQALEDREPGDELSPALALKSPPNRRRTRTCAFANRENVGRVDHPSIMLRRSQKWNGVYKLIVRLGATANKKERNCPRLSNFSELRAMHAARSDDEGSPIFGARAHRDRKQGSEQLLISFLVRTALEPATRPL